MLVDVTPLGVTGREAEELLDGVGITVNKNAIPFDPMPPDVASGIRVGTPAATTRGLGPDDMREVAGLMLRVLWSPEDAEVQREVRAGVQELCRRFPVPGLPVAAMAATN
jgi:glycine hydroxymethyltransferase